MKFKFSIYCLLFITVVLINNSCKKYPEDPSRTLKPVVYRFSGEWHIEYILIDDVNVTDLYSDSIGTPIKDGKIEFKFKDSQDDKRNKIYHRFNDSPPYIYYTAEFDLENKKNEISFCCRDDGDPVSTKYLHRLYHELDLWRIKKLYKKDFRIELFADNKHYEIYYRKK